MKKLMIASCVLALSMGGAFAQSQTAPGASSEGYAGHSATKHMNSSKHMKKGTTTGMAHGSGHTSKSMANPSSAGNAGPGTK